MNNFINIKNLEKSSKNWHKSKPFPYFIVDNFFDKNLANILSKEFPKFNDKIWHEYGNQLEIKKVCNNWNVFPKFTYQVFSFLNSTYFTNQLSRILFKKNILISDNGLNGGGWHIHKKGGKLNTHLDYSMHPKLNLERRINIIIYLNPNWKKNWGGCLGFWDNQSSRSPGKLIKEIEPLYNRAVIFDTSKNSWHGLPSPLMCPNSEYRKSLAIYYLTNPSSKTAKRSKALFSPTENQKNDKKVLELIKKRSNTKTAHKVYL